MGHYCSVRARDGWPCQRWLVRAWVCHQHRGPGPTQPSLPLRFPRVVRIEHDRITGCVPEFAADIIAAGEPLIMVAKEVADLTGPRWDEVAESWRTRSCDTLARVADTIDDHRARRSRLIGDALADAVVPCPPSAPRCFCYMLVSRVSEQLCGLPPSARLTAASKGLRLAGVALCAQRIGSIAPCRCFRDLFSDRVVRVSTERVAAEAAQWLKGVERA